MVDALANHFKGSATDAADFMRWAFERAIRNERAGKESQITAAILFSGSMVTDHRVTLRRRGALPDDDDAATSDKPAWVAALTTTKDGDPRSTVANVVTILRHDSRWDDVLAFDEFAGDLVTRAAPPWYDDDAPAGTASGDWSDEDITRLCAWLQRAHKLDARPTMVLSAVAVVARRTPIHPVRDWLQSLPWDGVARLDSWLVDLCGAEDTRYTRAIGRCFLIAAVARIERPGCKVDTTLVLQGDQGRG